MMRSSSSFQTPSGGNRPAPGAGKGIGMGGGGGGETSAAAAASGGRRPPPENSRPYIDFIWKTKYTNTLPDLPFEPKLLQSPFPMLKRFIEYKPTSLEKDYKYELLVEPDLGVKIDLIDPMTYWFDPDNRPAMNVSDEKLLEEESTVSLQNLKRSMLNRKIVPWMRKTEYISDVNNRFGVSNAERQDTKIGVGLKKKYGHEVFYKDRDSQIAAIEKTFADAKRPVRRHFAKRGVVAVAEYPIFPDFEMWKYPFAQVLFDADPLPLVKTNRKEKLENALLRGMRDAEGANFVGYFAPTDETVEQRALDVQNAVAVAAEAAQEKTGEEVSAEGEGEEPMEVDGEEGKQKPPPPAAAVNKLEAYNPDYKYVHKLEREYTWEITKKGVDQTSSLFLTFRDGKVFYDELDTIKLYRRGKAAGGGGGGGHGASARNNTVLIVTNRPPDAKEQKEQSARIRNLLNPYEQIEEEEDEEDEEQGQEEEEAMEQDEDEGGKEDAAAKKKKTDSDDSGEEEDEGENEDSDVEDEKKKKVQEKQKPKQKKKKVVSSSSEDEKEEKESEDSEKEEETKKTAVVGPKSGLKNPSSSAPSKKQQEGPLPELSSSSSESSSGEEEEEEDDDKGEKDGGKVMQQQSNQKGQQQQQKSSSESSSEASTKSSSESGEEEESGNEEEEGEEGEKKKPLPSSPGQARVVVGDPRMHAASSSSGGGGQQGDGGTGGESSGGDGASSSSEEEDASASGEESEDD